MGKTGFVLSLLVVGLIAQSALCSHEINQQSGLLRNIFADEENDSQIQRRPMPFRAGQEYVFEYNGQVASGLLGAETEEQENTSKNTYDSFEFDTENVDKQQKAVLRIQSKAKITFNTEHRATLRLEQTRIGQLNNGIFDPKRVQPIQMFEKQMLDEQKTLELEMPCEFRYVDGVVERIQFHPEDKTWSKNIKRAVLNLIQVNMSRKNIETYIQSTESSEEQRQLGKAYTIPEITIEGDCLTTYTINENRRQYNDEWKSEEDRQEQQTQFNVTKSINFKQCKRIADVAYGFQSQDKQSVKCARLYDQQQQREQKNQVPYVANESCDPKEVNDDKLDRSTVQRFELVRKSDNTFAIQRVESLSHYTLKNIKAEVEGPTPSAMHTVVLAELVFRGSRQFENSAKASHYQLKQLDSEDSEIETLLYDNEWEVENKRFFMYGDAEISRQNTPYRHVAQKVEQAQTIYRRLIEATNDKINGVESDSVAQLQRLVEILRMSSVEELEKIYQTVQDFQKQQESRFETEKVQQLLADTLAIAGTRNTVYVLVQKIQNKKLSPAQAAQALKNLHGLPAPSDAITEIVSELAKSELVHRSPVLKQTVWLTFGAMIGELCRDKISAQYQQEEQQNWTKQQVQRQQYLAFGVQSGFEKLHVCPQEKKESYKHTLLQQYKHAETTYEKILALKAIGNAGLDNIVHDLERIINGKEERINLVRIVAINALRRLRNQMPRKIQRVLLPIFQNTKENSNVRIAAISLLMSTQPEQQIVDQIVYTLSKERSVEVQAFTYGIMKTLSESEILEHQDIAKHIKIALKLSNINEETIKLSKKWQLPLYSTERQDGVSLKWSSIFSDNQMLPSHIAAGLDSILNGKWQNDIVKLSLSQQGTNRWIENLMQLFNGKQQFNTQLRGSRVNRQRSDEDFQDVISRLDVTSRREQEDKETKYFDNEQAFLMISLRLGDVDHAIFPINARNLPQSLKTILEDGEKPSLSAIIADFAGSLEQTHVRWLSALTFNEKFAKVPTPIGFPLSIQQSTPMLTKVEANAKLQSGLNFESTQVKTQVQTHIISTLVHMQKMEIWTPLISTGVESIRGVEFNAPLHFDIQASRQVEEKQNGLRLTWKLPQQNTRLFGAHTMTTTYVQDNKTYKKELRTVYDSNFERALPSVVELNKIFGEHKLGLPIRVNGHFHMPSQWNDFTQIFQILMATENHIHIELEPTTKMTREIIFQIQGSLFQKVQAKQYTPELNNFYADAEKQFLSAYPEDQEDMQLDENVQRRHKLSKTLERLQQQQEKTQMYKHALKLSVETVGEKKVKAEMKLQAVCDAKFYFCKMYNEIKRTPLYADETSTWTLKQKVQTLVPESVSSIREMEQLSAQKNQKFFLQMDNEWGTEERTQFINLRIHGENAQTKQQREQEFDNEGQQYFQKKNNAFINKYDIVADYKLKSSLQNAFQRVFEVLKTQFYWNTESRMEQTGRDGQLFATVVINPLTQRQAYIAVRTPTQAVRIVNAQMPIRVRPMPLVRASQKPVHSISQVLTRFTSEKRAECVVGGSRVETFDQVLYKAPITKCYSVLAKDCRNVEQPRFVVLMKSLENNGEQKKLKVITPEQVIECQPKQHKYGNWKSQKIVCTIDGQEITAQQQQTALTNYEQNYQTVEYNNEEQTSVVINVNGVSVRFGCECANCECQRAWIKLSDEHKNTQCGLCGHYDDNASDEWRMNNNELTDDLTRFHRSFTLQDKNECTESKQNDFYLKNKEQFRVLDNERFYQREIRQENEESNEQVEQRKYGGYAQENESDEEWDREYINRRDNNEIEEPKMKIKVLEQNNHICFSIKPVKQCPSGYISREESETVEKQKFACLSRSSSEARRVQDEVRRGKLVNITFEPNFVHQVVMPTQCVRAY